MNANTGNAGYPIGAPTSTGALVRKLNLANVLTLGRLALVPVFLVALLLSDHDLVWRGVATGLFVIAAVTDQVDGWVARRYELITDFGRITDPIADKALIGAALLGLSLLGDLPWWVTLVIATRELAVTGLRFWVIRYGVIAASRGGKAKTLAQIVAIGCFLVPLPAGFDAVRWTLMGIAIVLTVATGLDYLARAVRLRMVRDSAAQNE